MKELTEIEKLLLATRGLKEGSIVADRKGQPFRVSHINKEECVIVSCDGRKLKHNEIGSLMFTEENLVKIGFKKIRNKYQCEWNSIDGTSYKMVITRTASKTPNEEKGWRIRKYDYEGVFCDLRIDYMSLLMDAIQDDWRRLFSGSPLGLPFISK